MQLGCGLSQLGRLLSSRYFFLCNCQLYVRQLILLRCYKFESDSDMKAATTSATVNGSSTDFVLEVSRLIMEDLQQVLTVIDLH